MYDLLTTGELTVLQRILYEGAEEAYRMAGLHHGNSALGRSYRGAHRDVALQFIEAATELIQRLDRDPAQPRQLTAA
jgi:hypothetical protein